MSVSPTTACDFWNGTQQFYKNGNYFNTNDYYGQNNYNPQGGFYNRHIYNNTYVDYPVKNEEEKYNQYINQACVQDHFITKNESTITPQQSSSDVVGKSEYLNQFDSCRQVIYNNSMRLSPPSVNNIVPSNNTSVKETVKPDTTDSPTLRALLSKPKEEKSEFNTNYENNCQDYNKMNQKIDYQFSPDSRDSHQSNNLPNTDDINVFYPWMKTNSQGKCNHFTFLVFSYVIDY